MSNYKIALAGNPNTGKSTLFNALTGLRQHTGNWAGKTVELAEGTFTIAGDLYTIFDLPGTYSLHSNSEDEEVARDYILFGKPDVTVVVIDATALERNLNLALQVLEITGKVVVCINLIDEAERKGISIDAKVLENELMVPVVKISARNRQGFRNLFKEIARMAKGEIETSPFDMGYSEAIEDKIRTLEPLVKDTAGKQIPSRWLSLRLLDGDDSLIAALKANKLTGKDGKHHEIKFNQS